MSDLLEGLEVRIEQKLEGLEARIEVRMDQKLESLEVRMDQKLERLETKLLTAFHNWASPMEARLRSHSALLRALDVDIEQLDERLKKLEPPSPAS